MIDWIIEFIEGEGCFNITIQEIKNKKSRSLQIHPNFQISIGEQDKHILELIKSEFGFGNINLMPKKYWTIYGFDAQNQYQYKINNINDCLLLTKILDDQLISSKKQSYIKWKQILLFVSNYEHLNKKGILNILQLRDNVNNVSKRKNYKDYDYYSIIVDEMDSRGLFSEKQILSRKSTSKKHRCTK